jgi:hypothetical protein
MSENVKKFITLQSKVNKEFKKFGHINQKLVHDLDIVVDSLSIEDIDEIAELKTTKLIAGDRNP